MKKVFLIKYNGELIAVCTSKRTAVEKSIEFLLQKDFIKTDKIAGVRTELNSDNVWNVRDYVLNIIEISTNEFLTK